MRPSRVPQAGTGDHTISWSRMGNPNADEVVLLIPGANTNHALPQPALAELPPTPSIHWSSSAINRARLKDEPVSVDAVLYGFDLWSQQVADFCSEVIDRPVRLVGNSIGGVAALRAAQLLEPLQRRCADRLRPAPNG